MENIERLTAEELAVELKVSIQTVYKYVGLGIPTYSKKPLRFILDDCWKWISER